MRKFILKSSRLKTPAIYPREELRTEVFNKLVVLITSLFLKSHFDKLIIAGAAPKFRFTSNGIADTSSIAQPRSEWSDRVRPNLMPWFRYTVR